MTRLEELLILAAAGVLYASLFLNLRAVLWLWLGA